MNSDKPMDKTKERIAWERQMDEIFYGKRFSRRKQGVQGALVLALLGAMWGGATLLIWFLIANY